MKNKKLINAEVSDNGKNATYNGITRLQKMLSDEEKKNKEIERKKAKTKQRRKQRIKDDPLSIKQRELDTRSINEKYKMVRKKAQLRKEEKKQREEREKEKFEKYILQLTEEARIKVEEDRIKEKRDKAAVKISLMSGITIDEAKEIYDKEVSLAYKLLENKRKREQLAKAREVARELIAKNENIDKEIFSSVDNGARGISKNTKQEVWARDEAQCVICGSEKDIEYDHIIPFSKGGSNTNKNIQLLCRKCNRKKNDKIE